MTFEFTRPNHWRAEAADATVDPYDSVVVDASNGPVTITLPTGPQDGDSVGVRKGDNSQNLVTIADENSLLEGGAATIDLALTGQSVLLGFSTEVGWQTVESTDGKTSQPSGTPVIKSFEFNFDDPDILTGAQFFVPQPGDVLLQAFVQVVTPFDGTTPLVDFGVFSAGSTTGSGYFAAASAGPIDLTAAPATRLGAEADSATLPGTVFSGTVFTSDVPLQAVVSSDGGGPRQGTVTATAAPGLITPLTVVTGTNDEFVFNSVTYTVEPGEYADGHALASVMNRAVDGDGNVLTTQISITFDGTKLVATGAPKDNSLNGATFGLGANDFLAASGFVDSDAIAGGAANGGDPGSTQGQFKLYVVTATPQQYVDPPSMTTKVGSHLIECVYTYPQAGVPPNAKFGSSTNPESLTFWRNLISGQSHATATPPAGYELQAAQKIFYSGPIPSSAGAEEKWYLAHGVHVMPCLKPSNPPTAGEKTALASYCADLERNGATGGNVYICFHQELGGGSVGPAELQKCLQELSPIVRNHNMLVCIIWIGYHICNDGSVIDYFKPYADHYIDLIDLIGVDLYADNYPHTHLGQGTGPSNSEPTILSICANPHLYGSVSTTPKPIAVPEAGCHEFRYDGTPGLPIGTAGSGGPTVKSATQTEQTWGTGMRGYWRCIQGELANHMNGGNPVKYVTHWTGVNPGNQGGATAIEINAEPFRFGLGTSYDVNDLTQCKAVHSDGSFAIDAYHAAELDQFRKLYKALNGRTVSY